MLNVTATLTNIGRALCESSVIPFLIGLPRCKVWLMPAAAVPCSNAAKMYENARLGRNVNFAPGKILSGAKATENVYTVQQPMRRSNIVQSLVGLR